MKKMGPHFVPFEMLEDRRLMSVTSAPPYLVPTAPGIATTPVLTVGDAVGGYRMVGIPDGLGAFDNGDGTFTVLMNHELRPANGVVRDHGAKGAFVSKWVIDKATLNVLSGDDQIKSVFLYNTAAGQYEPAITAFNRFCSATLAERTAYFNPRTGRGTRERIFTNGEETAAGRAFAHVVSTGQSYEFAGMGNLSFENVVPSPFPQDLTLVAAQDDANRLFTSEGAGSAIDPVTGQVLEAPSEVYFYLGEKKRTGSVIDKAGLTGGMLAGLKVGNAANEAGVNSSDRFSLASLGDVSTWDEKQLQAASIENGVTQFRRPEDGSWDPNDRDAYRFVTTDVFGRDTRLWKLTFDDIRHPEQGGTIEIDVTSPAGAPGEMFDNITHNYNSDLIIQEDPGNQPYVAKLWHYDTSDDNLVQIAQHDPRLFDPAYAGSDKNFLTQDEESSGVIDLSKILGPGYYLADVQAHYAISAANPRGFDNPDELVEGGQLLMINTHAAKATLSDCVLDVTGTVNDDRFAISRRGNSISVFFNGQSIGAFDSESVSSITVSGGVGDDVLGVVPDARTPVLFDGGPGDDTLLGRRSGIDFDDDGRAG